LTKSKLVQKFSEAVSKRISGGASIYQSALRCNKFGGAGECLVASLISQVIVSLIVMIDSPPNSTPKLISAHTKNFTLLGCGGRHGNRSRGTVSATAYGLG